MPDIVKSECKVLKSLQNKINDVFETYSYEQIIPSLKNETVAEKIYEISHGYFSDETFPQRYFFFGEDEGITKAGAYIIGENSPRADAEVVSMMVNCILACGISDFKISVADESVYDILCAYELQSYIELSGNGFSGIDIATQLQILGGKRSKDMCAVYLNMDNLMDALYDRDDMKASLLPVAIVGGINPTVTNKVAFGLRSQGVKIEGFVSDGSLIELTEYGEQRGVTVVIWVDEDLVIMKNLKTGEISKTTADKLLKK